MNTVEPGITTGMGHRIIELLWLVHLFRPERLVSFYFPSLLFFNGIQTVILIISVILWLSHSEKKGSIRWLGLFLVIMVASSFFAENTGFARIAVRIFLELYVLAAVTFTYFKNEKMLQKILLFYYIHFLWFALWGIWGWMNSGRGIVEWDYLLNEEDAYGPLMCIGAVYCYYYRKLGGKLINYLGSFGLICCIAGLVLSYARGAFLSFIMSIAMVILFSKQKIKTALFLFLCVIFLFVTGSILFPENSYIKEMETISEGFNTGTGFDRKILWTIAWWEFVDNPFLGVGPNNFGVQAPKYVAQYEERQYHYRDPASIWGRAVHNGYFQILSELGLFGFITFLLILWHAFKLNSFIQMSVRNHAHDSSGRLSGGLSNLPVALQVTGLAILSNIFFYDIIFYNILWDLLIINQLVYFISGYEKMHESMPYYDRKRAS